MKKALALVLALVLALSLGVSAFALSLVDLEKEPVYPSGKTPVTTLPQFGDYETYYWAPAAGGEYYFEFDIPSKDLKDITVTVNGPIAAEIVKYDPDTMKGYGTGVWFLTKNGDKVEYADLSAAEKAVYDELKNSGKYDTKLVEGKYAWYKGTEFDSYLGTAPAVNDGTNRSEVEILEAYLEAYPKKSFEDNAKSAVEWLENYKSNPGAVYEGYTIKKVYEFDNTTEAFNKALAKALRNEFRTEKYAASADGDGDKLLKITVDPNYSASYKIGDFKVKATHVIKADEKGRVLEKETVVYTGYVVSDVVIFEYEEVKWAAKEEVALRVGDKGYSDFSFDGYYGDGVYDEDALRVDDNATVISTTAFRAIREAKNSVSVAAGYLTVTIPEVGSGQKGVNFEYRKLVNPSKEEQVAPGVIAVHSGRIDLGYPVAYLTFGFYGDQVIASDFTVDADLNMTAYELRELFGEKVEEEDIITYYVVKDDEVVDSFTIDYMTDEMDENIVLTIKGKAGSKLGMYKITTEAPAAPEAPEGEENPNTGAESVIGVVAAMAVVSVAAAAAVSLKK